MYEHPLTQTLLARLAGPVQRIIVLTGPRQVGKTTLVRNALKRYFDPSQYLYLELDDPAPAKGGAAPDIPWLAKQWGKASAATDALGASNTDSPFILALDEIQKIPDWSRAVKGLWDADRAADRPMHVVILGSTPLLMQRELTESLAGRFERLRMTHWSFKEMADAFGVNLNQYVYFGGYPGSIGRGEPNARAGLIDDIALWKNYVQEALIDPNIKRDILMMQRVDKPKLLRRVFELGCDYSGQELSYTKMVGELTDAGNTTTVAHYLDLLNDAGLLAGLQKYSGARHRRRSSSPKLAVHNTALMSATSSYTFDEAVADRTYWGRLAESAVGAHLINASITKRPDFGVYYWRSNSHEVDFVLTKGRKIVPIEVKSGTRIRHRRGLETFGQKFPIHREVIISEEDVPLDIFLLTDLNEWFS